MMVRTIFEKGGNIVNDSFKIAFGFFKLPGFLIKRCLVVKRCYDKFSFNSLATTGSILKYFLGFCQIDEGLSVLKLLNVNASMVVEFLKFLIEFL
jgi:hypothetical protein